VQPPSGHHSCEHVFSPKVNMLLDSQPTSTHATISQQLLSEPETSRPSPIDHDILSEDTGQPLSRCEPIDTSTSVVEDLSMKMEAALEMRVTPPPSQPTHGMVDGVSMSSDDGFAIQLATTPWHKHPKRPLSRRLGSRRPRRNLTRLTRSLVFDT
jgi:hypothetical protein